MDDLTVLFASKLNLREGVSRAQTPRNNSTSCHRPWFAATVTIPSPAPHPALLRTPYTRSTSPSASNSCLPYLNQVTRTGSKSPIHRSPCQNASKNRKMAPLPRRTPPKADSAVDSLSISSRASSLSSVTSSQSRSTSTSSSSSISSADPVSLLSSPISQYQDIVQIENEFEAFNEYINARSQPHSDDLSPLDLGLLAKQTRPPFSQYRTNPFTAMSTSSYLAAPS